MFKFFQLSIDTWVLTLPPQNYLHDGQDRAEGIAEAETMPKSIHPYQQQINIKQAQKCINGIFKASLFEWNFVLFKILQIKNIPALHCKCASSRCE